MKTNAIIRILIWSIVILALVGILIVGLTFGSFFSRNHKDRISNVTASVTDPTTPLQYTPGELITLTEECDLHSSPSADSPIYTTLTVGTEVEITKRETIMDTEWAFIIAPEFGWIPVQGSQTAASTEPTAVPETETAAGEIYVLTATNLHSSPTETSTVKRTLDVGQAITVSNRETFNGIPWAYITSPETGWVLTAHLNLPAEPVPSPEILAEMNNKSSFDTNQISSIRIEWVAGNIIIEPWDGDKILVSDTGSPNNEYNLFFKHKGEELQILFCQELQIDDFNFGIRFGKDISKDLLVQIPRSWTGQELDIDCAAASLEVYSQNFREVEIDGASGTCLFDSCAIGELDLDTASGDVEYSGTLNSLDFDAASASFKGVLTNVPRQIDMDSMSGDLDLTLPEDAGFTVKVDGMSSDFSSDFPTTTQNGRHICGDGYCRIDLDAMSGDLYIRKHHPDRHH